MATSTQNPNGFSYAQAAKGRAAAATSQTPSSKVTSGTATPATGTFSELTPNGSWADDVEATEGEKSVESRKVEPEEETQKEMQESKEVQESKDVEKAAPIRDIAVERTKSESRIQTASSGVSSPDLAATSSVTNTDDSSSAPNGISSSDTTWETKSQNSEPAWIAERKERQTTDGSSPAPATGSNKRGKKESKEAKEAALAQPPPKPVVLHEAPPPQVNIWAKRMEDASKKPVVSPTPKAAAPISQPSPSKENNKPKAEPRKKASPVVSSQPETQSAESKKPNGTQPKRAVNEPRTAVRQATKPVTEAVRDQTNTANGRTAQREPSSVPALPSVAPPPVKDEISWPTPDSAQEKERKAAAAEKESEETDADSSAAGKSRDKTKWTPLPVTPTIVWQTEEMNRPRGSAGERGGRGSTTARGRGGLRGGPSGSKGGERASTRTVGETENANPGRGRSGTIDREAMPPPVKPSSVTTSREAGNAVPEVQSGVPASAESRHTKSPSKTDFEKQDASNAEPRHVSHDIRVEESREGAETVRDASTKKGTYESKKESRSNFDSHGVNGKDFTGRAKARGGRGRGGAREFANGHQQSASFANGHTEYGAAAYGVPQSPSAFQSPRGANNYAFAQQGRGGWTRGANSRSQSIPVEQIYGRPQGPPVQTYYPGMYEYPGAMAMTPAPFSPMMDPQYVVDMVSTQLEYYFSLDNLLKDMFLRKNMDTQGFVFLDVVANFNRLKQLTVDKDVIKYVCLKSEAIEIRVGDDGKDRLRRREGWEQFVLPTDQREVGAQTNGPQELHRPEPVQLPYWPGHPMPAFRGPPAVGSYAPRASLDSTFAMNGGVSHFAPMSHYPYGGVNGEENRGRAAKSPVGENGSLTGETFAAPGDAKDAEPDVFPDDQLSSLTVVVKMGQPRQNPHHTAASRTFSNGSIDTRSVYSGVDKQKPGEEQAQPVTNGEPLTNGDKPHATPSRHASPSLGRSPEKTDAASELTLLWVKDKEIPQDSLPQDAALEPYVQLRVKALKQREQAATGACPYDLDVLYQFWSHFLIRNFNNRMYGEFKFFAGDDAQQRRSPVGLQNLVQFYAKALASSNPIRDHIVKDYVVLVKSEPSILNGQAHKQLRQAWRNGALNLKNRKKLSDILDDDIKQSLEA